VGVVPGVVLGLVANPFIRAVSGKVIRRTQSSTKFARSSTEGVFGLPRFLHRRRREITESSVAGTRLTSVAREACPANAGGAPSTRCGAGLEKGVDGQPPPTITVSGDCASPEAFIPQQGLKLKRLARDAGVRGRSAASHGWRRGHAGRCMSRLDCRQTKRDLRRGPPIARSPPSGRPRSRTACG
jgi:hypothetical protein